MPAGFQKRMPRLLDRRAISQSDISGCCQSLTFVHTLAFHLCKMVASLRNVYQAVDSARQSWYCLPLMFPYSLIQEYRVVLLYSNQTFRYHVHLCREEK